MCPSSNGDNHRNCAMGWVASERACVSDWNDPMRKHNEKERKAKKKKRIITKLVIKTIKSVGTLKISDRFLGRCTLRLFLATLYIY